MLDQDAIEFLLDRYDVITVRPGTGHSIFKDGREMRLENETLKDFTFIVIPQEDELEQEI